MSPDGKNVYVTTFKLDTGSTPPEIEGTLTTFTRDESSGALTQTGCVAGGVPTLIAPVTPPSGCSLATFPQNLTRVAPLGTASDVEVSPDGKSVVTSSFLPGAVINWNRDTGSGALTPERVLRQHPLDLPDELEPERAPRRLRRRHDPGRRR